MDFTPKVRSLRSAKAKMNLKLRQKTLQIQAALKTAIQPISSIIFQITITLLIRIIM